MRSFFNLMFPPKVRKGDEVKADDYNKIIDALKKIVAEVRAIRVYSSADITIDRNMDGSKAKLKRRFRGGSSSAAAPCFFGEIITYPETEGSDSAPTSKTGIRGGYLEAGKKIWEVPNQEIDLETDGVFRYWIRVPVTANTDSAGIATLSGLDTSEEPVWESGSGSDNYPDKTIPKIFPTTDPGSGELIVPIGTVTVADGKATIVAAGCGNIIADHCPGKLTHHRGPVSTGSDSTPV